jgi:uncharacterized membrane protein (DUF106 family)
MTPMPDSPAALAAEDGEFAEALEVVYERTDGGGHAVEWADVRDELTSGQWGRLIEKGVLVDDEGGFVIADVDAVETAIEEDEPAIDFDDEEIESTSWSTWDKAAGLVSLAFFAGYSIQSVRGMVGGTVDLLIGPINAVLPFYATVLVLALMTGLYSSLLQGNLMNPEIMAAYQERMQAIQDKRKAAKERGDEEALERIQKEQMAAAGDQLGMFKEQFRPMAWIMLLTIPLFLWMYWMILDGHIAASQSTIVLPLVGEKSWTSGMFGTPLQAWIVWYFLCSMGFSQLMRKSLDIDMTPSTS